MSLTKKWSSLPILHFAIFHHYCHETGHSGFILQPNKKLSKGNLFTTVPTITFHHFSSSLLPTTLRSQSSFSFQSSWPPTPFEMRMGRWGEKPRRNTPPRCQYSDPGWMRRTCDTPAPRQWPDPNQILDSENIHHRSSQTVCQSNSA